MNGIFIPFTNATSEIPGFWVDDEDVDLVRESRWQWFITKTSGPYARSTRDREDSVKAHRLVLGLKRGDPSVDHKDGDGLNNRKENLRVAGQSCNNGNRTTQSREDATSQFKGVGWDKQNKKWKVRVMKDAKEIWLGRFENERDAAMAYDKAALEVFGEYAKTNAMMGLL